MKSFLLVLTVVLVGCGGAKKEERQRPSQSEPQSTAQKTTKTCYWCKEEIKVAALVCKHCGSKDPDYVPPISDPIVEKAIREELKKPTGELTKADLEKVTWLGLSNNQLTKLPEGLEKLTQLELLVLNGNNLTDVKGLEKLPQLKELNLVGNQLTDVSGLEKLNQLTRLYLANNPALTEAQIDELKKALPKCDILSNPTK